METVNWQKASERLIKGEVGVIPTDTLYGISASIKFPQAIERIYEVKKRSSKKPFIVLVNSLLDLIDMGISLSQNQEKILKKIWPGETSVVLNCPQNNLTYLHRGEKTLAFRWPKKDDLNRLLSEVGPLVSTTANSAGEEPAKNRRETEKYFFSQLDFFLDEGELRGNCSNLIDFSGKEIRVLRKGKNFSWLEKQLF